MTIVHGNEPQSNDDQNDNAAYPAMMYFVSKSKKRLNMMMQQTFRNIDPGTATLAVTQSKGDRSETT